MSFQIARPRSAQLEVGTKNLMVPDRRPGNQGYVAHQTQPDSETIARSHVDIRQVFKMINDVIRLKIENQKSSSWLV